MSATRTTHIVPWSGGIDSTLTLAQVSQKYGTPNEPVVALTILPGQMPAYQSKMEAKARARALPYLRRKWGCHINHESIEVKATKCMAQGSVPMQRSVWLIHLACRVPSGCTVHLSMVKNEDFWSTQELWMRTWNDLMSLMGKTETKIEWYWRCSSKKEVVKGIYKWGDLVDHCWYCEAEKPDPTLETGSPCYECSSCETHDDALKALGWMENDS